MFTTAKSMRTLISSDSYPEIQFGVKLSAGNIGSSKHVFTAITAILHFHERVSGDVAYFMSEINGVSSVD